MSYFAQLFVAVAKMIEKQKVNFARLECPPNTVFVFKVHGKLFVGLLLMSQIIRLRLFQLDWIITTSMGHLCLRSTDWPEL